MLSGPGRGTFINRDNNSYHIPSRHTARHCKHNSSVAVLKGVFLYPDSSALPFTFDGHPVILVENHKHRCVVTVFKSPGNQNLLFWSWEAMGAPWAFCRCPLVAEVASAWDQEPYQI